MTGTYCADFETTSNTNLAKDGYVRVWLWSLVSCDDMKEYYGTDMQSFLDKIWLLGCKKIYFHNLRFDGTFLVDYLLSHGYLYNVDFTTIISDMNVWYEIKLIEGKNVIKIWDSLKKYPQQSVQSIAEMYGIEGKKEKPFFDMYRPEGYKPTKEEIEYCLQDSRIIAYAMHLNELEGNVAMTLSSDAFNEVKLSIGGFKKYRNWMPQLPLDLDAYIRRSYRGGWTFLQKRYAEKELENICVYDVNSLYPWAMCETELPYGNPVCRKPYGGELYVMSFEADFDLKPEHLPTIQVKDMPTQYKATEYVESSTVVTPLCLTSVDYELFKDHYDINYMSEPEYWVFRKKTGLLKPYIDNWMAVKEKATIEHKKADRFMAKRKMNSPYGKTGMKPQRKNKIPNLDSTGFYYTYEENTTDPIYVPYASFVCAQARNKTIRSAQREYDHFVYADTDSLHLIGEAEHGLDIHPTRLGYWDFEGVFERAKYLRPKTYIHAHKEFGYNYSEYVVEEIKCAGMQDEIKAKCQWEDFQIGTVFPNSRKLQKRVKGGLVLVDTDFTIKDNGFSIRY